MRKEWLCSLRAIEATIRINQVNSVFEKAIVLYDVELQAARSKRQRGPVVHTGDVGIPDQIRDVAVEPLVMVDREAFSEDLAGVANRRGEFRGKSVIKRIDLVIEPVPSCRVRVELALQRNVVVERPLEASSQPQLIRPVVV